MSLFKRSYSSHGAYARLDKEDPEEIIHRRAQFLIYKAMEQADNMCSQRRTTSFLRRRFCKVKVKIGNRFKNLRRRMSLMISVTRTGAYKQMIRQLKTCKGLFSREQNNVRLPALLI